MDMVPEGYSHERIGQADVLARNDVLGDVRAALLDAGTLYDYAARHPEAEAVRGRQTLYVIPGPGSQRWIVRQLSHGGLLAPITGRRFLRRGTPRPFNELQLSLTLRQAGIHTPAVVAAAVYHRGLFYGGDVAREAIGDAHDLADCLFGEIELDASQRGTVLVAAGRLIGSLHRAGVLHPDLNLRNILIQNPQEAAAAYILDIEKCRIVPQLSGAQREGMLARMARSAHKFEIGTGRHISADEWMVFRAAYKQGRLG
ncbi:MAG TPA: lipopolysaccharide kinase InaA family protein [Gemmatimonadota bacterium]|nr:lipopolysaccharide kinase InaA family protein [Gemmatimonadota bacterium]